MKKSLSFAFCPFRLGYNMTYLNIFGALNTMNRKRFQFLNAKNRRLRNIINDISMLRQILIHTVNEKNALHAQPAFASNSTEYRELLARTVQIKRQISSLQGKIERISFND
jgi:hypothetical protein